MAVPYDTAARWALPAEPLVRRSMAIAAASQPKLLAFGAAGAAVLLTLTRYRAGGGPAPVEIGPAAGWFAAATPWLASALGHPAAWLAVGCAIFVGCLGLLRVVARFTTMEAAGIVAAAALIGVGCQGNGITSVSGTVVLGGAFSGMQAAAVVLLLSLSLAINGSLAAAIALLGVVFDLRPDVALWSVAALAGASVALWRDGVPAGRAWVTGGGIALLLAMPALVWWGHALAGGSGLGAAGGVSPDAAVAWMIPLQHWVLFVGAVVLGLAAFAVLGPDAGALCGAFLGCLAVFAVGCVLPLLTGSPGLLSLRLVDVDAVVRLLAIAAATTAVVRDLRGGGVLGVAASAVIAATLLLDPVLLPVAALAMLARAASANGELLGIERRIRGRDRAALHRTLLAVVLLAAVAGLALRSGLPLG